MKEARDPRTITLISVTDNYWSSSLDTINREQKWAFCSRRKVNLPSGGIPAGGERKYLAIIPYICPI